MNECPKSDGNNPVRLEKKKVSSTGNYLSLDSQIWRFLLEQHCYSRLSILFLIVSACHGKRDEERLEQELVR